MMVARYMVPASMKVTELGILLVNCKKKLFRGDSITLQLPLSIRVGQSVINSFRCDAIASPSFASSFHKKYQIIERDKYNKSK